MRVLIIDDEPNICKTTALALRSGGYEVLEAADRGVALRCLGAQRVEVVLLDMKLGGDEGLEVLTELLRQDPRVSVVVFTAFASVETAVEAMRRGAVDYIAKPFTPEQLREVMERVMRTRGLQQRVADLETRLRANSPEVDLETHDEGTRKAYEVVFRAAQTPATILLGGESGTGKTVLARVAHERGDRRDAAFVTISCPSLSSTLFESELFGHLRGSFTGALTDTWGKVAHADGGTLFLDEIGELPLEIQPKLLRLLQEHEYERVGESKTRKADVRLIAATNRDLEEEVRRGRFREDLYYRINVIAVRLPALRERPADLLRIATKYLSFFAAHSGKHLRGFTTEAERALLTYAWPGNLRELRNCIERVVILAEGDKVGVEDLPEGMNMTGRSEENPELGAMVSLARIENEHIRRVVDRTDSLDMASRVLGIDPATLYRKRKRMAGG